MRKEVMEFKKGAWEPQEDLILTNFIETHGEGKWNSISKRSGLMREGKSCRMRWKNYLRPNIKRGPMSQDEEDLIVRMHKLLGNRWSLIAGRIPGRTDNDIKNYWNSRLSKTSSLKGATTSYSNCKKRKASRSSNIEPTSTENTRNNNGTHKGNDINNPNYNTNGTEEASDAYANGLIHRINEATSFPCDIQRGWLSSEGGYGEPFSPCYEFDAFMLDQFKYGLESWNGLSDHTCQFLL